eukprot:6525855-Heterocapsa_arctica.AAC.1
MMTEEEARRLEKEISHLPMMCGGALFLLLDAGSFEHTCPRSFRPDIPIKEMDEPLPARTANGQLMKCYGRKEGVFYLYDDQSVSINFVVMDVRRPLLSVGKLVAK